MENLQFQKSVRSRKKLRINTEKLIVFLQSIMMKTQN